MELLFRLIRDGKVVGYERHVQGEIWRTILLSCGNGLAYGTTWCQMYAPGTSHVSDLFYKEYDRKDMYTGVMLVDGSKIFEKDKLSYGMYSGNNEDIECVFLILWDSDKGAFCSKEINCPLGEYRSATGIDTYEAKIIGIEGVEQTGGGL